MVVIKEGINKKRKNRTRSNAILKVLKNGVPGGDIVGRENQDCPA